MPKTTNIGLELTTNDQITFEEWRKIQNGENSTANGGTLSNMQIIDAWLAPVLYSLLTITPSQWEPIADTSGWQYVIDDFPLGLEPTQIVLVSPKTQTDFESFKTYNISLYNKFAAYTYVGMYSVAKTRPVLTCAAIPTVNIGAVYFISNLRR